MRMWVWMACLWLIVGRPVEASVGHPMGQKALSTLLYVYPCLLIEHCFGLQ